MNEDILELIGTTLEAEMENALRSALHGVVKNDVKELVASMTYEQQVAALKGLMATKPDTVESVEESGEKEEAKPEVQSIAQKIMSRFKKNA